MSDKNTKSIASSSEAAILTKMFDLHVKDKYGDVIAPPMFMTPTGIVPIDTILGGGLPSSGIIMCSATPETGKSTFAFQFSKIFQESWENSLVVYLDTESVDEDKNTIDSSVRISRIESFNIDTERFKYYALAIDIVKLGEMIKHLIKVKQTVEQEKNKEFKLLIVWDSLTATPCSKSDVAENPNQLIGKKARETTLLLDQVTPLLKFNRVTLLCIDQTRANISVDGPYVKKEKTVGQFNDVKSASQIFALNHAARQWLFLSKGKKITPADGKYNNINGWEIILHLEKSKTSPSSHSVTCIFDKNHGISKFWTEMNFLCNDTNEESKIYKTKKSPYPKYFKQNGAFWSFKIADKNNPENKYDSGSFYFREAEDKYLTDEVFRGWFDYAVQISCNDRLVNGIMKMNINHDSIIEEDGLRIDTETGEVLGEVEQESEFNAFDIDVENIGAEEENDEDIL